jgi:delta-aminolevulinic acid dehydratase/porphobilinogen synthase
MIVMPDVALDPIYGHDGIIEKEGSNDASDALENGRFMQQRAICAPSDMMDGRVTIA